MRWGWSLAVGMGLVAGVAQAGDWPRFRGPNGSGVSPDATATPTTWSPTENLKWKAELPGEGVSCPIVVGDRVFVTTYSGYGFEGRDEKDLKRHLVCFDRATGKVLWDKSVDAVLPEDPFSGMGVPAHGYASHTPVSDGRRVYAFFGKTGVVAFDLDGTQLWRHGVGTDSDPRQWGSASSPILVDGVVVVTAGPERRAIVGLDAETGKELWEAPGAALGDVWGTPAVATTDGGRTDVVIGTPEEIWGLNPQNGKLRWYCTAIGTDSFNTSVVVEDGVVYAVEGRSGGSVALRAGGKDDVTATNVLWSGRDANRFGTPVLYDGRLYFVSGGIVNAVDAKTGKKLFRARLAGGGAVEEAPAGEGRPGGGRGFGGGGFGGGRGGRGGESYSSPVAADGKVYFVNNSGETYVFKAADTYQPLAVNRVTTDGEVFAATPAISNGELFIRSNKHLYCVAEKK